ncbi:MAG TPA: hypothetical protein VJQ78_16940 [Sphingobium sp.]|nr:hypothetical protein [Sphingobium sp.]
METISHSPRGLSRLATIAIAFLLFASIMILTAIGPARAGELPSIACHHYPAALRYLA